LGEIREELGAERARRQMAERRAAALEAELEALREPRESSQIAEEGPERAESRSDRVESQEGVQRPWWRRIFNT